MVREGPLPNRELQNLQFLGLLLCYHHFLKHITSQVRHLGQISKHLQQLIKDVPEGAETFVLRILHVLTDKG